MSAICLADYVSMLKFFSGEQMNNKGHLLSINCEAGNVLNVS